jgi:catechol 2,3-dioxygenase-like lactoylglutathione lyase family enzyme
VEGDKFTVQGRIRMSDDLDEARIFFVDVEGQLPVRVEVDFKDFHNFNLAYHCGTGITLQGTGRTEGDQKIITNVTDLKSVFGKSPGSQNG